MNMATKIKKGNASTIQHISTILQFIAPQNTPAPVLDGLPVSTVFVAMGKF